MEWYVEKSSGVNMEVCEGVVVVGVPELRRAAPTPQTQPFCFLTHVTKSFFEASVTVGAHEWGPWEQGESVHLSPANLK